MRYVLFERALNNRVLSHALTSVTVLQSLAGAIGRFWMGSGDYATSMELFVLLTLLPLAGILHLMYLAKPRPQSPVGARLAAT